MPAVLIERTSATPSFSTHSFGATLMSAIILAGVAQLASRDQPPPKREGPERGILASSYSETTITPIRHDAELLDALHRAYHDLAAAQSDLDVDAKRILQTRLWDLYD